MESNPIGDMFKEMRAALDEYLASILQKAVDGGIITEEQRNGITEIANRDAIGR